MFKKSTDMKFIPVYLIKLKSRFNWTLWQILSCLNILEKSYNVKKFYPIRHLLNYLRFYNTKLAQSLPRS